MVFDDLIKAREQDFKDRLDQIPSDYVPFYVRELTREIEDIVTDQLERKIMFRIIASNQGEPGIGKTSTIYRVAKTKGWQVVEFSPLTDFNDDSTLNTLRTIITSYNNKPTIVLFDNIEDMTLPIWFAPTDEEYEDKKRPRDKFLDVAMDMYTRVNFTIMATATEYWRVPKILDNYFIKYRITPPDIYTLRRAVKPYNIVIPAGFPLDLNQLHFMAMFNGIHTPYERRESPFETLRNFLVEYPKKEFGEDLSPKLDHWLLYNLFNNRYLIEKHTKEFYETIAVICLADRYGDEIYGGLPAMEINRGTQIFYPR